MNDNIFKLIRNILGLNTKQMASLCRISAVYYNELERGIKRNPSRKIIENISINTGLSVDTIYRIYEDSNQQTIKAIRINLLKSLNDLR